MSGGLAKRIAVTIGVPIAYVVLGNQVPLPGVPDDLGPIGHLMARTNTSAFALGVMPIISAYWFVELIAFVAPWWRHLRHGNPEGRAKLDRASRALAIVLAAMQAFGVALSLQGLAGESDARTSVPILMATLVGGVCVTLVLAETVTRSGLVNGVVALVCARELSDTVQALADSKSLALNAIAATALAFATLGVATWCALRGAGDAPAGPTAAWLPVPASSVQPYQFAVSLLMLPATLANFHLPVQGVQTVLGTNAYFPIAVGVAGLATFAFARVLHRPEALARLSRQLGARGSSTEWRASLRRTLAPSVLFMTVVVLAVASSRVAGSLLTLVVAAGMDFARAVKQERASRSLVVVWEERRATAVPMVRALLARDGIASEARGAAVLGLLQVFAPYAPAQILVEADDSERAHALVRAAFASDDAPAPPEEDASPARVPVEPWPLAARTRWLGGAVVAAVLALATSHASEGPAIALKPRAKIEVTRVDDTVDAFASVRDEDLPAGQGVSIYLENVPAGRGRNVSSRYARIVLREGEGVKSAAARIRPWLDSVTLPPDRRFALEALTERDDATDASRVVGIRTLVLAGEPVLRTADIVDAAASVDEGAMRQAYVLVTLSDGAAKRFEDATREWTGRRLAILVDDEVTSAPVVKTAIGGGHISITMGAGDPDKQLAEARDLEARLRGGK